MLDFHLAEEQAHIEQHDSTVVESFPSWEISGQLHSGVQSLDELAQLSGYKGPRNFKNFRGTP